MAKRTRATKINTLLEIEDFKKVLAEKIVEKYKTNIHAFSISKQAKDLGLDKGLSGYLSKNGATSLKVLNILAEHFKMGTIIKETEIVKKVNYTLCQEV